MKYINEKSKTYRNNEEENELDEEDDLGYQEDYNPLDR